MYNRSLIFQTANTLSKAEGHDLGFCLKKVWAAYKLILKMEDAKTSFSYIKGDGTLREAVGMIEWSLEKAIRPQGNVMYHDIETGTIRSFKISRLQTA